MMDTLMTTTPPQESFPLDPLSDAELAKPSPARVLIIGSKADSRHAARRMRLSESVIASPMVLGYVDAGHGRTRGPLSRTRQIAINPGCEPIPVLGRIHDLPRLIASRRPTHVVITQAEGSLTRLRRQIAMLRSAGVTVLWLPEPSSIATLPADAQSSPLPTEAMLFRTHPRSELALKRCLDIVVSVSILTVLSPILALVALGVLLTSGRPILYSQTRVGRGGKPFSILKFRSMRQDAEKETGPIWASSADARCTRFGAFLRRTNLDEMPQLLNVLRGDMTLVGPRPERPVFIDEFRRILPDYDLRHAMPVGMTGWAQVHGWRGRTSIRKRLQYDLDYIQRWSFWMDLRVLWMTIEHVLLGRITWIPRSRAWWERRQRWP
jgi:exopolysaccharide biosynthesis polyprenyl glycosylphosphotransferase